MRVIILNEWPTEVPQGRLPTLDCIVCSRSSLQSRSKNTSVQKVIIEREKALFEYALRIHFSNIVDLQLKPRAYN